jgi:Tol biopolymer transport system component/DNA-binding winged helix-turn-helix (wHTH) protein
MSAEAPQFYEFENFRLDTKEKILFRDNKPVPLRPKVFATLEVFLKHAGRLLEKDELMQKIWKDQFVEESNLSFNIKVLRRVLNDDAHQPRFIETVPRRGYRFIAEVSESSAPGKFQAATSVSPSVAISSGPASRRKYWSVGALMVLLLVVVPAVLWSIRRGRAARAESATILSAPFKSENFLAAGTERVVITPDGKYVAYTTEVGGKTSLWLRQLETSENIQIVPPSNQLYRGLAISHDGNSLYFARDNEADRNALAIYRVMTFGGIPVKIAEHTQGWISLSPDDRQISFVRCKYEDEDYCALVIADADGKNEKRLLTRPRPFRIVDNQFSPDGKLIAFASGQSRNGAKDFRLVRFDLANNTESQISAKTFFEIRSLKWLPDGNRLLFTALETLDGPLRIWEASIAEQEVRVLTNDAANYSSISLDRAADKMVATLVSDTFHLYLAPVNDLNNVKSLAAARTFTFTPAGEIVFAGDDGDIWTINRNGGEQRQLTNSPFKDFSPRVSPDGRYIFFGSTRSGSLQVWRMNSDGSNQVQLTSREGGYPIFVTPDGRWLYFGSGLQRRLWRISLEGTDETQVSEGEVLQPAMSLDGKLVAYFSRAKANDPYRLAIMSVDDGKIVQTLNLADESAKPVCIAWELDNQSFEYITLGCSNSLWRQALNADRPHFIADLGTEEINDLALSPDGNYVGLIRGKWTHGAVLIEGLR